jgi:SAM-dependent methyltransferase
VSQEIDWRTYYQHEPAVCDFEPSTDGAEIHRCLAAWSVFPGKRFDSLLDVGCGDGFFCHWIARRARIGRLVGVDVSEPRLARARARYPGVEYRPGELPALPFDDGEFEVVTCIEVLEHQPDPVACLKELARVGQRYVVITVPHCERLRETLCPHCLRTFPADGHLHSFDENGLRRIALLANLIPERVHPYSITIGHVGDALPSPFGQIAAWALMRISKNPGTFIAASIRKP